MMTLRLLNDIFVRKFHQKKGPVMQALNTPLTSVLAKYHPNGGLCCPEDLNAAWIHIPLLDYWVRSYICRTFGKYLHVPALHKWDWSGVKSTLKCAPVKTRCIPGYIQPFSNLRLSQVIFHIINNPSSQSWDSYLAFKSSWKTFGINIKLQLTVILFHLDFRVPPD